LPRHILHTRRGTPPKQVTAVTVAVRGGQSGHIEICDSSATVPECLSGRLLARPPFPPRGCSEQTGARDKTCERTTNLSQPGAAPRCRCPSVEEHPHLLLGCAARARLSSNLFSANEVASAS